MRVPDLAETQAHLSQFGYEITRYECDGGERKYELLDRQGQYCGSYKSLVAFWAAWLERTSELLRPRQLSEAFLTELGNATPGRKEEMLDSFEDYYTGRNEAAFNCWEKSVMPFYPEQLPEDWEIRLADQIHGRCATWESREYILDALCREHLEPSERWEKYRPRRWL
jgi:hypothetical protein